ncbi:MAG TPA: winged helix-turn-helix domain-containing protein [Pyrinomonadaceae bacterium]|nr:winged helix-turn-helix domain-containing protein [Pyrinomonadaceae bacterium]
MPEGFEGLRFPCECVSSRRGGYSEPWAAVAKNKLLPDGTKEEILNLVAREPRTISQLAEALGLSAPSVYAHVSDMLKSELLREAVEWEKTHPAERYYEPNFPVIKEEEAEELCRLCDDLAEKVAALFRRRRRQLEKAFGETPLAERGWDFAEVAQFIFASAQRRARGLLEQDGVLSPPKTHRNGVEWVFWAEEPKADSEA